MSIILCLKCVVSQSNVCLILVVVMTRHLGLMSVLMSVFSCLPGIFFFFCATVAIICCVFCVPFFGEYCCVVIGYDLFYIRHTFLT